jgi:hypothetical protein
LGGLDLSSVSHSLLPIRQQFSDAVSLAGAVGGDGEDSATAAAQLKSMSEGSGRKPLGSWAARLEGFKGFFINIFYQIYENPIVPIVSILGLYLAMRSKKYGLWVQKGLVLATSALGGVAIGTIGWNEYWASKTRSPEARETFLKESGAASAQLGICVFGALAGFPRSGTSSDELALTFSTVDDLFILWSYFSGTKEPDSGSDQSD